MHKAIYEKLKEVARDRDIFQGDNKYIFWVSELNRVYNYWSSH